MRWTFNGRIKEDQGRFVCWSSEELGQSPVPYKLKKQVMSWSDELEGGQKGFKLNWAQSLIGSQCTRLYTRLIQGSILEAFFFSQMNIYGCARKTCSILASSHFPPLWGAMQAMKWLRSYASISLTDYWPLSVIWGILRDTRGIDGRSNCQILKHIVRQLPVFIREPT